MSLRYRPHYRIFDLIFDSHDWFEESSRTATSVTYDTDEVILNFVRYPHPQVVVERRDRLRVHVWFRPSEGQRNHDLYLGTYRSVDDLMSVQAIAG